MNMPEIYLIIVIILMATAVSNLIAGVANDAVNFLNSAIGSKVATRNTIMIIASIGVFVGATFSSGMMEVTRKGIFNPEFFYFSDVMVIFLSVMLTNIVLLDVYNTFGMPTSTTVSLVFELLGAAMMVAALKILAAGDSFATFANYINTSSAIIIISGIFISVGIAFVFGALIMFFSRLLFSFHIEKRMNWIGGIWSGLSLAAMSYYLLIKGVKGASFLPESFITWVGENSMTLLIGSAIFWTVIMQISLSVFRLNILKFVVLFGTFSLAMAFAGNDLVNFIGVPIAGLESFIDWSASGTNPEGHVMTMLTKPVKTNTYLLLLAGVVMILTLLFSKKARTVTDTEINLGRQSDGSERFAPNLLSKGIVRYSRAIKGGVKSILPNSWMNSIMDNYKPVKYKAGNDKKYDPPAFDLVRASVNLTIASALIAFGTSLKLPLSTTFVTFMVAMGSSLSDKAWGRDSAVYRIAGVLNVIGGWFLTAIIALSASALFAFIIFKFGIWGIGFLVMVVVYSFYRMNKHHTAEYKEAEKIKTLEKEISSIESPILIKETSKFVAQLLSNISDTYRDTIDGLLEEDRSILLKAKQDLKILKKENKRFKSQLFGSIKRLEGEHLEITRLYLLIYDLQQDIVQSTRLIVSECDDYVSNSLPSLKPDQKEKLSRFKGLIVDYFSDIITLLNTQNYENILVIMEKKDRLLVELKNMIESQVKGIKTEVFGLRNSLMFFSLQLETKDLIAVTASFVRFFSKMQENVPKKQKEQKEQKQP